jgi:hypothetical protein
MTTRIKSEQMLFTRGPFAYEFIETRKTGKWRIHDRDDNAVGSAETEEDAKAAVARLNQF